MQSVLGIIGGSGIYDFPGLQGAEWRSVGSPWGEPSDSVLFAELEGLPLRFLPRHGRGHRLSPTHVNYRANLDALKRAGVTDLITVSAVGSLRDELPPGTFVLVDQFIDWTHAREKSFFGEGIVAHVSLAEPVSPALAGRIDAAGEAEGISCRRGGTCIVIEGPQFATVTESRLYRKWGCDVIGMTSQPEAKLAREAELPYATIAMVTDFDSWRPEHGSVDVGAVVRVMGENRGRVQRLLTRVARDFPREHEACPIGSDRALDGAIMTARERWDPALAAKLDAVAGRVLRAGALT